MSALDPLAPTSIGYSRHALFGREVVWLLEIEYAGVTWRWSSEPIEVDDADGNPITFAGGLEDQEFDENLAIVGDLGDDRSVSLELMWDPPGVAFLIARGHDLAASYGELSYLVIGQEYESRVVVLSGRLSQPAYGGPNEPVKTTLSEQPSDDTAELVPASYLIGEPTGWDTAPSASLGKRYPIPFGPGNAFDVDLKRPLSPAYALDDDGSGNASTLVVAGGQVASTEVSLLAYIDGVPEFYNEIVVDYDVDALGQLHGYVDVSAASATFIAAGQWWVYAWDLGTTEGAILDPFEPDRPVATAGQLLRYLASRSSVRCDLARFASIVAALDWPVCGYIDDDCSPLEWMIDQLLPILPISLAAGPDGLQPVLWRYDARREEAIEAFEAGPGVVRVGDIEYEAKTQDLYQRIVLRYGYNAANKQFGEAIILEPLKDDSSRPDVRAVSDTAIRAADTRYTTDPKKRRTLRLESAIIQSPLTASRVVHWLARKHCYSPRIATYDVGQEYGWLELGSVVTITDTEVSLDAVALVVGRRPSDSGVWRYRFHILDGQMSDPSVEVNEPGGGPTWTPGGN